MHPTNTRHTTQKICIYLTPVYYNCNTISIMHYYTWTYYYAYYETYMKCRIFFLYCFVGTKSLRGEGGKEVYRSVQTL